MPINSDGNYFPAIETVLAALCEIDCISKDTLISAATSAGLVKTISKQGKAFIAHLNCWTFLTSSYRMTTTTHLEMFNCYANCGVESLLHIILQMKPPTRLTPIQPSPSLEQRTFLFFFFCNFFYFLPLQQNNTTKQQYREDITYNLHITYSPSATYTTTIKINTNKPNITYYKHVHITVITNTSILCYGERKENGNITPAF